MLEYYQVENYRTRTVLDLHSLFSRNDKFRFKHFILSYNLLYCMHDEF